MISEEYILYILMRTDLPSMNSGKAMAQASHASNKFVFDIGKNIDVPEEMIYLHNEADNWQRQTNQGFGTVLVLECTKKDIDNLIQLGGTRFSNYLCGTVIDPTYPYIVDTEIAELIGDNNHTMYPKSINDNKSVCFREEITCAYAFSEKNNPMLRLVIGHLNLHP